MKMCPACGLEYNARRQTQQFCSRACRDASLRVVASETCATCGKTFERLAWQLRQRKRHYCSWECFQADPTARPGRQAIEPVKINCVVCGTEFETGGRGRPARDTRFCSRECRWAGRYRHGTEARELSVADAAYLAGFVDGEGSVVLYLRNSVAMVRLSASNTKRGVLDWIVEATGVGRVQQHRLEGATNAASFFWLAASDTAVSVLKQIRPYMRVKHAQADLAIETQERLRQPALKADRTWQGEYRARMQALNKRGPRPVAAD